MSVLRSRKEEAGEKFDTMFAREAILVQIRGAKNLPSFLASRRPKLGARPDHMRTEWSGEGVSVNCCARVRFSSVSGLCGESRYFDVRKKETNAERVRASVMDSRSGPERRSVRVMDGIVGCSSVPMRRDVLLHLLTDVTNSTGTISPRKSFESGDDAEMMWGYTRPLG